MSKLSEIIEGWKNDLLPKEELKEIIRKNQQERLSICINCEFNSTEGKINFLSTCKKCGCFLKKKTACLSCKCPIKKWEAVLTNEEDKKLDSEINYKEDLKTEE